MPDPRYNFRLTFRLPEGKRLSFEAPEYVLYEDSDVAITLRSTKPDTALSDVDYVAVIGSSFVSDAAAMAAGDQWRSRLEHGFACVGTAADFGDRAPGGWMSADFLSQLAAESGNVQLNDIHGLMTYAADLQPGFWRTEAKGVARVNPETQARALTSAHNSSTISNRERLAYDLFSASQFVAQLADARFIVLMMAFETLVEPRMRDSAFCDHIDSLVTLTEGAELEGEEKRNLQNALRSLKRESARAAGRRLAASMAGRTYGNCDPATFFAQCYGLRSALVHGHVERPSVLDVGVMAAHLELLVGHLIAGRALVDDVLS